MSLRHWREVGSVTDSWEIIHYSQQRWRGGTTREEGAGKAEGVGVRLGAPSRANGSRGGVVLIPLTDMLLSLEQTW